jgi:hypothetical protein
LAQSGFSLATAAWRLRGDDRTVNMPVDCRFGGADIVPAARPV